MSDVLLQIAALLAFQVSAIHAPPTGPLTALAIAQGFGGGDGPKKQEDPGKVIRDPNVAPGKTTPPKTPNEPPPSTGAQTPGFVTNSYSEADIRSVLAEIATLSGTTIIPDGSVTSLAVSIEFENEPVESAIRKLASFGGYYVKKKDGIWYMSAATPDAPLFREFAVTRRYIVQNTPVESLSLLIPARYRDFVQSDKLTNMVTIQAAEPLADLIVEELKLIDSPVRQFVVEALVTEVTTEVSDQWGFSWNWRNFGIGTDSALNYAAANQEDVATLKSLISNGRASVRANPRVAAFEGREANLNVGQETFFSILAGNPTFPVTQIQQIKTGVTLRFTGFLGDDGMITLKLAPEVSDAVTVTPQGNPSTIVRRVETTVRVKPGDTVAIGGMIQEFDNIRRSRIPILGELPLIGQLFQTRRTSRQRTEVIILITPRLIGPDVGPALDGKREIPTPLIPPGLVK